MSTKSFDQVDYGFVKFVTTPAVHSTDAVRRCLYEEAVVHLVPLID